MASESDLAEIRLLNNAMAQLEIAAIAVEQNLANIESVLQARKDGTLAEPSLNLGALPESSDSVEDYKKFVEDNIIAPFDENKARFESLTAATQAQFKVEKPIFDLTYGPPKSTKGSFILSNDGLYYDSVNGGIPEVSGFAAASSTWNLSQAPNLGGKGMLYDKNTFDDFEGTVLDYDYTSNDPLVTKFYDTDDILETFEKNKVHHTTIVYDQIALLTASGFNTSSAIVVNHYSNIAALATNYDNKIKKRKKQLQLVALFGTDIYSFTETGGGAKDLGVGEGFLIENISEDDTTVWNLIERIPLNDFSFLKGKGVNVPLKAQEELLLFSEDLDDIILPLTPVFVESPVDKFSVIDKFTLTPTSPETFPYLEGTNAVTGTDNPGIVQSLTDSIVTDGLLIGYNFLQPKVTDASSNTFNVDNFAPDAGGKLDAQLVGPTIEEVFDKGLGIPKLNGTAAGTSTSYVRLPSNFKPDGTEISLDTQELDNLFYPANAAYDSETKKGGGVTFDCWVHVPSLTMTATHRYRVLAACENSGGNAPDGTNQGDIYANRKTLDSGLTDPKKVHGMIIGFRDKGGAIGTSGLEFGVFPTVSQNHNSGDFGHSICIAESMDVSAGVIVDTSLSELGTTCASTVSVNGISITDVSAGFVQVSVVFDFDKDELNLYFDAELLKSSTLSTVFDLSAGQLPQVPSVTKAEDGTYDFAGSWQNEDKNGPVVGNLGLGFTPWILGGGFSDGIGRAVGKSTYDPGFLGYNTNTYYGGPTDTQHQIAGLGGTSATKPVSGLGGYIGSFKLYSRALSNTEIRKNYSFQKGFFKNIQI